jgi:hypothetical protein
MTRRRRGAALLWVIAFAAALAPRWARAQTVTITMPVFQDSISPSSPMLVQASALPVQLQPQSLQFELSLEPAFSRPFAVFVGNGAAASFQLDTLIKPNQVVYFRARLFDQFFTVRAETVIHFPVRSWARLITPGVLQNNPGFTRQPEFAWSAPGITLPPGPWIYTVTIINTATGGIAQYTGLRDTTFVPVNPLDACTSYKWTLLAAAQNGGPHDTMTVASPATFTLQTPDCPTATTFYQNFPNPFGGSNAPTTCFWFDLAASSKITLTIYDIRLHPVRRIIPGPTTDGSFDAGAFGRQDNATQSGCEAGFSWDGRDDGGRFVPPGVYIAVFAGAGKQQTRKILYRGR